MDPYEKWNEARTRIEPGEYHIRCIDSNRPPIWLEGSKGWGKLKNRVVLWFEVVEGPCNGKIIPMFFNLPESLNKVPDGSRYYDAWRIANGGQRPPRARFKEMNPSKFLNKSFRAEVVDIKPKWRVPGQDKPKEIMKPAIFHYSKVYLLYELITGG